ncbi:NF-X1-type zinc finger protein NFXL1-like [Lolium rigidum]|uniref:NF-X1-type zinc finger protein NFXL1-like n=1 Tax=Lolium rigidum TaxID=89674 RepID=UPI001F5DB02D|nr:NF-X1-type zinc finger protein NFXL1-like [Lolium rigidum]
MQPSTDQRRGNDNNPPTPASSRGLWRPRYAAPSPTPAAAAAPRPIPTYVPPHHRNNNSAHTIPASHAHHRNTNYRQTPPQERPYPFNHTTTTTTTPRRGPPHEKPAPAPAPANAPPAVPQLVQEIQDKLAQGAVECMICYDMVGRSAPVWSCASCFAIFHLACTRKWARSPASHSSASAASAASAASWRCPGCQSAQAVPANDIAYACFCGRRRDPPNDLLLTPHSCGHRCSKPLAKTPPAKAASSDAATSCPHLCVLQCHPGPCPPCKGHAPAQPCPCGKQQAITRRCADRATPLTCGQHCERLLPCGRHRCEKACHTGPCGDCQVNVSARCFCGRKTETVLCGEMAVKGELSEDQGVFSCGAFCGHGLACGNHACRARCHPGPCGECELVPEKVTTCHCGKTRLQEKERTSCFDPVPTCDKVCERKLLCGVHRCRSACHEGKCPPCVVRVEQRCSCGSSGQMVECYVMASVGEFRCSKPCGRKKNCGRHRCSECCCPLSKPFAQHEGDTMDPHFCLIPCGKMLRCGQHGCQHLCHSGHCDPCRETIFHDLTCACGRTSVPPPQPCGTPTPSCPHKCTVPQPCGHPASHQCHSGDCPPCVVPVMRACIGGHVMLRNIPCGSKDIRCNRQCGLNASPRDPARAATALRCLDYGSAYQGDAMLCPSSITQASSTGNVWGGAQRDGGSAAKSSANPWNKAGASEPASSGDSTVLSHSSGMSVLGQVPRSAWRRTDTHGQVMGTNKLTALESPASTSSSSH